jgi:uncharacterized protein (TIGR02284 family)
MVTMVGMQGDFASALKDLVELDYDAVEAYEAAINRLDDEEYKDVLKTFKEDHERHISELSDVLREHGETPPKSASVGKQWLTKGKVLLGNMIGDDAILAAMKSNEVDTNTAYERMSIHDKIWDSAKDIIKAGLEDERRHKDWFERNT